MARRLARALCILVGLVAFTDHSGRAASRPNVLVIVSDDLGYSDLGCYGGEINTPHLDQLAANGLRLTQFHTTARCCPSRASILTGHYPHRVGLGHMTQDIGQPGYRGQVASGVPTVADVLSASGYRTFISGKWHLGTDDPTRHGFEQFYGTLTSARSFWQAEQYLSRPQTLPSPVQRQNDFYGTDVLTDFAIEFIQTARRTPDQPWFLYLAYNAPHFPLQAREKDIQKYAGYYSRGWDVVREQRLERMKQLSIVPRSTSLSPRSPFWNYGETRTGTNPAWHTLPADRRADLARRMAIYAAMVDCMDQNIGRVVADLRLHAEFDDTLIIFLSDNGACAEWDPFGFDTQSSNNNILHTDDELQQMGQPGSYHSLGSGWANAANTPFRLYKHFCHQGGVLSPCIVHCPARIESDAGQLQHQPAHLIDLLPTILQAAKIKYPQQHAGVDTVPLPGENLLFPVDRDSGDSRAIFLEHEGNRGLRKGRWKLVALKNAPWELFDLATDPIESINLAGRHPERVKTLAREWDRWASENNVTPLPADYRVDYLQPQLAP